LRPLTACSSLSAHNACVLSAPPAIERSAQPTRRVWLFAGAAAALGVGGFGCAAPAARPFEWESRLRGSTWVLLGEVHDNAAHHRLRTAALARAIDAGWRPALVMEQFDIDRQGDIDRARGERPRDAQHVIAQAGAERGWHWPFYEPVIALALSHGLPLVAGNVPRSLTMRLAREDYEPVLGIERVRAWGLDAPPDAAWQAAQEREIDGGHCNALPQRLWPGLARGQFARDAAMAQLLQQHGERGAVLWAGNGHVRRDLGVPRWLARRGHADTWVVGFVERGEAREPDGRFDATVVTAAAEREDPCQAFKARPPPGSAPLISGFGRPPRSRS
jgi:uncharacterized iron-regulated protein